MRFKGWKEVYLGDIATFSQGKQVPIKEQYEDQKEGYIRFLRIVDYTNENEPIRYVKNYGDRYFVNENDLVMIRYGSKTAGKLVRGHKGIIANNMFTINVGNSVDKDFGYYLLSRREIYKLLNASQSSSTMPAISFGMLDKLKLSIPSISEQRKIAYLLLTLDNKIELNNQINQTLEEMAQAIFKHWFVDFEFPNENGEPYKSSGGKFVESELGMIPDRFEVGKFSDLVTIRYGKSHTSLADGIIPVYGSGGIMRYVDTPLYSGESVLIPRKGTLNNVLYINGPFWSVDTMFYTEMETSNIAKYVYYLVKSKNLIAMDTGSAVPSMTTKTLNNLDVVIPPKQILFEFKKILAPLFNKHSANYQENIELINIRDALLPKLMSGEIRIPDAEQEVEACLQKSN